MALAAVGALLLAAPAQAEEAKAGPFYKQGMAAMWDIGLLLPDGKDARIHIQRCDVGRQQAICRLRVAVTGLPACQGTTILQKRRYSVPAALWGCPKQWRPVLVEWDGLPTEQLVMKKAYEPGTVSQHGR